MIYASLLVIYIVGVSGFVDNFKHALFHWLRPRQSYYDFSLKPFDCPPCAVWWTCCIMATIWFIWCFQPVLSHFETYLMYLLVGAGLSCFSLRIAQIILLARDTIKWLTEKILFKLTIDGESFTE